MQLTHVPRRLGQLLVRAYQKTLSPDHGPLKSLYKHGVCKFHPTCSEYTHEAIGRYGLIKGTIMGTKRIARCHPWSVGGHDPVP